MPACMAWHAVRQVQEHATHSTHTSGAIQHGDPTNVFLVLRDCTQPALRSGVAAEPRSASMMPLLLLTRMLPALMSLMQGRPGKVTLAVSTLAYSVSDIQ